MHKVSSENRTQSIKRVAEQISDSEMIFKVENALYHSACITRYLLRNIKTEIEEPPMSEHENAFDQFVSTIQEDLLIHKKVFYLNHLLEKFVPFLPEDMREIYTTYRLQQKLEKHFGDAIVIQCQQGQGMSNIVYSSSICLSEAIDKANRLKADMKSIRTHDISDASSSVCDEDLTLHKALDVKKLSNFGDLAIFYLKHMSMLLQSAETIVDVFDRYDLKDSIKSAERERRSQAAGGHRIYHVNEGSSIPDWKQFLSINRNKQELISFLGEFISKFVNANNPLPVGQTLYLAGTFRNPEVVKKIAGDQVTDFVDLFSIQEEADTIIILHALYADEQFGKSSVKGRIIIKCSDTDVLVLCVHYYPRMQNTD